MIAIPTTAKIELDEILWFENCGKSDIGLNFSIRRLSDWNSVEEMDFTKEEMTLEARNDLSIYISKLRPDCFNAVWNELAQDARSLVVNSDAVVKAQEQVIHNELQIDLVSSVRWDLVGWIMEFAYKEKRPPVFFGKLMEVYKAGHYPCGMDEDGTIVIY